MVYVAIVSTINLVITAGIGLYVMPYNRSRSYAPQTLGLWGIPATVAA